MDCWNARPLIYHFFEIVQVMEGQGDRLVNDNRFPYKKGSIFLFTPLDCRGFYIRQTTTFCSIRFSEVFLKQYKDVQEKERISQWLKRLEHIFYHHNRFQELLIKSDEDCNLISSLIQHLLAEFRNKPPYHEENLQHFVTLILNIISRNVSDQALETKQEVPLINDLLVHIRQHIGDPDKLRVTYLADKFHLSSTYVGEYFRKLTGETLQRYITQYRIQMVQQRLSHSVKTVGQIADELGFNDESHLSRQFKKQHGISPAEYRKEKRA
jgi:YesN/AraC family two-component response regulator